MIKEMKNNFTKINGMREIDYMIPVNIVLMEKSLEYSKSFIDYFFSSNS